MIDVSAFIVKEACGSFPLNLHFTEPVILYGDCHGPSHQGAHLVTPEAPGPKGAFAPLFTQREPSMGLLTVAHRYLPEEESNFARLESHYADVS